MTATVVANAAISLDGFVANLDDDPRAVFDFWQNGTVEFAGDPERVFHVTQQTADYLSSMWSRTRVEIIGRRLFDITSGWDGRPPAGSGHVLVVTHEPPTDWEFSDAPFEFIPSLERAVERAHELADEGIISLTGGDLTGQALAAGIVDEIGVQLTPVILGTGKRFFGDYAGPELLLDNPLVVEGDRVTHLLYRVRR